MTALIGKPGHPGIVFEKFVDELNAAISFRSLDMDKDLAMIHQWVNASYAKRFWQLEGSESMLRSIYTAVLANPSAHAFLGLLNGQPFCQVDAYAIAADEVTEHINAGPGDAGIHVLMGPPREQKKRASFWALKCFQHYYFSLDGAERLYAEPDQDNHFANQLAINSGFHFVKTIELSYKTANLYLLSRQQFQQQHS